MIAVHIGLDLFVECQKSGVSAFFAFQGNPESGIANEVTGFKLHCMQHSSCCLSN